MSHEKTRHVKYKYFKTTSDKDQAAIYLSHVRAPSNLNRTLAVCNNQVYFQDSDQSDNDQAAICLSPVRAPSNLNRTLAVCNSQVYFQDSDQSDNEKKYLAQNITVSLLKKYFRNNFLTIAAKLI